MLSLSPEFQLEWYEWILAFIATMVVGFSKTGLKGIVIIAVTLFALLFGSKASTGIQMALLIPADIFAVIYYRRSVVWKHVYRLFPWIALGVVLGTYVGKDLPEETFKLGMAIIILMTAAVMYVWDRQKDIKVPNNWWFPILMGLAAGFATMIGNLAGAFSNLYFLAMRLPKNEFIGTAAWLFFFVNLFKLPFHIYVWNTINMETLAVNIRLYPALVVGLLVGIYLIKLIKEHHYRKMILILTAIGALIILFRQV